MEAVIDLALLAFNFIRQKITLIINPVTMIQGFCNSYCVIKGKHDSNQSVVVSIIAKLILQYREKLCGIQEEYLHESPKH